MAGRKKPSKKYKPRAKLNPLLIVSNNLSPLTQKEKDAVSLAMHNAMYHLVRGGGTRTLWEVVTGSLNLASVLDEQVFMRSHRAPIDLAMQAHCSCGARFKASGKFGYTGKELQAVNDAIAIHEAQLDNLTFKELQHAIAETQKRLINRHYRYSVFTREERLQSHAK